jgi:hypothetical protein
MFGMMYRWSTIGAKLFVISFSTSPDGLAENVDSSHQKQSWPRLLEVRMQMVHEDERT